MANKHSEQGRVHLSPLAMMDAAPHPLSLESLHSSSARAIRVEGCRGEEGGGVETGKEGRTQRRDPQNP